MHAQAGVAWGRAGIAHISPLARCGQGLHRKLAARLEEEATPRQVPAVAARRMAQWCTEAFGGRLEARVVSLPCEASRVMRGETTFSVVHTLLHGWAMGHRLHTEVVRACLDAAATRVAFCEVSPHASGSRVSGIVAEPRHAGGRLDGLEHGDDGDAACASGVARRRSSKSWAVGENPRVRIGDAWADRARGLGHSASRAAARAWQAACKDRAIERGGSRRLGWTHNINCSVAISAQGERRRGRGGAIGYVCSRLGLRRRGGPSHALCESAHGEA